MGRMAQLLHGHGPTHTAPRPNICRTGCCEEEAIAGAGRPAHSVPWTFNSRLTSSGAGTEGERGEVTCVTATS